MIMSEEFHAALKTTIGVAQYAAIMRMKEICREAYDLGEKNGAQDGRGGMRDGGVVFEEWWSGLGSKAGREN